MQYAPLYDSRTETWSVIASEYGGHWWVHIPDAGGESTARSTAAALNAQEA